MKQNVEDLAHRSLKSRKLRDAAMILPFLGIFLFLTPIPAIFKDPAPSIGIPAIFAYIYGVWLILIVASALISMRTNRGDKIDSPNEPPK